MFSSVGKDVLYVGPPLELLCELERLLEASGRDVVRLHDFSDAIAVARTTRFARAIVDASWDEGCTERLLAALLQGGTDLRQVLVVIDRGPASAQKLVRLVMTGVGGIVVGGMSLHHVTHMVLSLPERSIVTGEYMFAPECACYCPRCRSLASPGPSRCAHCKQPRPEQGWPKPETTALLRLGQQLGSYTLTQLIGHGTTAAVYAARHDATGESVAIKVFDAMELSEPTMRDQLRREIIALTRAHLPHVVTIHDILVTDAVVGIVMDRAGGNNLRDHVRHSGPLSVGQALRVTIQIADALQEVHDEGIVHRDLKPANIHVAFAGDELRVNVVDFGVSTLLEPHSQPRYFYGTPAFASPEQVASPGHLDGRADVYGLAGVLYYVLTGQQPFSAENYVQLLGHQLRTPFPTLSTDDLPLDERCLAQLNLVIQGMSAKDMTERYHSMSQLSASLGALLARTESDKFC